MSRRYVLTNPALPAGEQELTLQTLVEYCKTNTLAEAPTRYIHDQGVSAEVWTINHNLGVRPHVFVLNSAQDVMNGFVEHPTEDQTVITFNIPVTGKAYLL